LDHYFLYPQINWNSKAHSLGRIKDLLNIGIDAIAFIDDQAFERQEVSFAYPEVLCIDPANLDQLLHMPELKPRFTTEDSKVRRLLYRTDMKRNKAENDFVGPKSDFLASLNMVLTIAEAIEADLQRAEELTVRTNQLNTTGYVYSYDELNYLRQSPQHKLLIAGLDDKFGAYGKIGLVLIDTNEDQWTIRLLLMSCRVMSRGIGATIINYIRNQARRNNIPLFAEMNLNERNRMMYMTYKFNGFEEKERNNNHVIFQNDLTKIIKYSNYIKLSIL
jgi:FkbH-like protein